MWLLNNHTPTFNIFQPVIVMMEMDLHPMFVSLMVDSVPAELITADGNVTCALTDSTITQTVMVYINTIQLYCAKFYKIPQLK